MIYLIIVLFIALLAFFLYYQNNKIDITEYSISNNSINNGVKIVHLSDFHSKPFNSVLLKAKEQSPDIIVITGDYINDHCKNKDKMLAYGKELVKICPVYYITGNHERRLDCFDNLMLELKDIGFNVILDSIDTLDINGNCINILGLDENQASFDAYKQRRNGVFKYKDNKNLFIKLSSLDGFKLVLSHYPENFIEVKDNNYSQYDFDLQLSGHAHGGQFIMPFIGPLFSPGQGAFPKFARGKFGDRPALIVSRGLGNSEFPFRLFNHPEIVVISINKTDSK